MGGIRSVVFEFVSQGESFSAPEVVRVATAKTSSTTLPSPHSPASEAAEPEVVGALVEFGLASPNFQRSPGLLTR